MPHGFVLHRPNTLRPIDVTVRRRVPITTPMRALLDAGAVLPRSVVGECVERALDARLVSIKGLRVILADLGGRGRTGTGPLRDYLDHRALGDARPESVLEPLMARLLLADLGVGPIEYQAKLVLDGTRSARTSSSPRSSPWSRWTASTPTRAVTRSTLTSLARTCS